VHEGLSRYEQRRSRNCARTYAINFVRKGFTRRVDGSRVVYTPSMEIKNEGDKSRAGE